MSSPGKTAAAVLGSAAFLAGMAWQLSDIVHRPTKPASTIPVASPAKRSALDVSASLAGATLLARAQLPDAELASLHAPFVMQDGASQLQFGEEVRYQFRSPSMATQPLPKAPALGAPVVDHRQPCRITVSADFGHPLAASRPAGIADCGEAPPSPPPRCTLAGVWQRALTAGAPAGALANIALNVKSHAWRWHFSITDRATSRDVYRRDFDDDCR